MEPACGIGKIFFATAAFSRADGTKFGHPKNAATHKSRQR